MNYILHELLHYNENYFLIDEEIVSDSESEGWFLAYKLCINYALTKCYDFTTEDASNFHGEGIVGRLWLLFPIYHAVVWDIERKINHSFAVGSLTAEPFDAYVGKLEEYKLYISGENDATS